MAVGNAIFPKLAAIPGVRLGVTQAGIRYPNRKDLLVIEIAPGSSCSAMFTRNAFCAAPVTVAKQHLMQAAPRYLLVNTGNANAGNGAQGVADALACCAALAQHTGVERTSVLPFSTGVIGEPLPVERVEQGLPACLTALSADAWEDAAHAIMTTDTRPKGCTRSFDWQGDTISISGIAKGAGMIRPDMATMLAFVATDAKLDQACLAQCLRAAVDASFHRITVDGDTSTNDACVCIATGQSSAPQIDAQAPHFTLFIQHLTRVLVTLAQALIRDAEGANKFITISVEQGRSVADCQQIAYTVAHSPLVKTAMFASDPNWGRILAAVGRAPVAELDLDAIRIELGDVCIVRDGGRAPDYDETLGQQVMDKDEIDIRILLGQGEANYTVWTSDFSDEYVRINAEYRS